MEFNATIDLIIKDLNDACQIIDDLRNYPGVPEIQVELAKAKCKSAGDVIALLKSIKQEPVVHKIEKVLNPSIKEVTMTEPIQTPPAEEKKPAAKPPRSKQPPEERDNKTEKRIIPSETEKTLQASSIIADKFTGKSSSINEQHGTFKGDDDITEIIKLKPIKSLKAAIGVNDRFLFIREIFNGDKEAYDHAIAKLEESSSTDDARAIIMSYTGSSEENEAVKELMDLVKRKHIPNE
jgi:hypothetical protein